MAGLASILWVVALIIVALWLLGFIFQIGGAFIHLLLVIAAIVIVYNLLVGGRRTP
ncbi:MAG TPA: lmo0937 family membrane protein [Chloroflexia bacterium]|nr:lmo0937 family membrane protein [Chloroflexia bacterium]